MSAVPARLEVKGLTKRFGAFVANDAISLTVDAGELAPSEGFFVEPR